jgi:hypothetical protein
MSGFREQRQAVCPEARNHQQNNICQGESQGKAKHPGGERVMSMSMGVPGVGIHGWSLRRRAPGIKVEREKPLRELQAATLTHPAS